MSETTSLQNVKSQADTDDSSLVRLLGERLSVLRSIDPTGVKYNSAQRHLRALLADIEEGISVVEEKMKIEGDSQQKRERKIADLGSGIDQFIKERLVECGSIQASVLYGKYSEYAASCGLLRADTRFFSQYVLSKGYNRKRMASGYFYEGISLMPSFPDGVHLSNALLLFHKLIPEYDEQHLRATDCRPWLIQIVATFISKFCEPVPAETIFNLRDLVRVEDVARDINLPLLIEQHSGECSSSLSLHLAIGLGSLWIDSSPSTCEQYLQSQFILLYKKTTQ